MARATVEVIDALRKTAACLKASPRYQWGHMGLCNCGFLAQHVTRLSKEEIHQRAMQGHGDWNEQLNDYCPTSGLPMDELISKMVAFGFDADDLKHLEKLSDPGVLRMLPPGASPLKHNHKHDVIDYLNLWAMKLEEELLLKIKLPESLISRVPA